MDKGKCLGRDGSRMTLAVIVQARFASSRLRGKVLIEIAGHTILSRVLDRCRAIPGADCVICAVPDSADSDPVASEAARCGVTVVRGSETDVLARYHQAAQSVDADEVLRVTSDCPLIDPQICGEVIALRRREGAAYASNNMPPSWPHGLDCEAFTMKSLTQAAQDASDVFDREHVTPFIRRSHARANLRCPVPGVSQHRWTLDTTEDLAFFEALLPRLKRAGDPTDWRSVLQIVADNPELAHVNAEGVR